MISFMQTCFERKEKNNDDINLNFWEGLCKLFNCFHKLPSICNYNQDVYVCAINRPIIAVPSTTTLVSRIKPAFLIIYRISDVSP